MGNWSTTNWRLGIIRKQICHLFLVNGLSQIGGTNLGPVKSVPYHPCMIMYGIFTYIYHKDQPNSGKYTSPMDCMASANNKHIVDISVTLSIHDIPNARIANSWLRKVKGLVASREGSGQGWSVWYEPSMFVTSTCKWCFDMFIVV